MKRMLSLLLCLFLCPMCSSAASAGVPWLHEDTAAFVRAKTEQRYVLLYLEAVWCHWCHVMDHDTYGNADVANEIAAHYVPLRIDQDARPDLANRYRDYGWPATVVFAADGTEIVKRRGYVAPERFLRLLRAIVADPSPEAAEAADAGAVAAVGGQLDAATREELVSRHRRSDDAELGGLKTAQKFLDRDSVEYALVRAADDTAEAAIARRSLDAARALFDPVWGGVYQYSTDGDWQHPHFEKLATLQAEYLRLYALAWAVMQRDEDRAAVKEIRRYLDTFLRAPDGGYYVSQDADVKPGEHGAEFFALDDAGRRAQGMPRIDRHRYTQQSAAVAEALATWAEVSGDASALTQAQTALRWVQTQRARKGGGGFRHDEKDSAGPYLADQLAVGRAALALYRADADRRWLALASSTADFIATNFRDPAGGFVGAVSQGPIKAARQLDENLALTRFAALLERYSGQSAHRAIAGHALRWLAQPSVALSRLTEAGLLLADAEFAQDPLHVVVVGGKSDENAKVLFSTLQHLPGWYKRLEWWDPGEGPLPYPDVEYPKLNRAAAFVCTQQRCSLPLYVPGDITAFLAARDTQG